MKLNYTLTKNITRRNHRGEVDRTQMTVHLLRANGKRVCRCNTKKGRGDVLSVSTHEYEELPEGAVMCETSAQEHAKTMKLYERAFSKMPVDTGAKA